ncbi:MAG: hypothetical protein OXE76_03945 [Alphaproteobacteria bacterium]|nr:hypothetical protein [Alphaproteobacteria bacterium]
MERREYHTLDKSTWGEGPWMNEPDKIQWTDEATGLPCLILRADHPGTLCGYVGVAEGHPYFRVDDDSDVLIDGIDVHGGLTFSGFCQASNDEAKGVCHAPGSGEPDRVWWLGFDCAHYLDKGPTGLFLGHCEGEYRDIPYVKAEVEKLAAQLVTAKFRAVKAKMEEAG